MIRKITVECSQCHQVSEIFLSAAPRIIIFNCPSCWAPLLFFGHKIFVLTDHQIEVIRNSRGPSSIMQLLHSIIRKRMKHGNYCQNLSPAKVHAVSVPGSGISSYRQFDHLITRDDITNLRIELETCRDAQHFIDKL